MAEPANPVRFDQTTDTRFFMCRSCRNHVLSVENYLYRDVLLKVIIGENVVNVRAADVESRRLFLNLPVVEVFCNGCSAKLGHKFVMIEEPDEVFQEGRFMLTQKRMLYWDGDEVVYADTLQPVEDN